MFSKSYTILAFKIDIITTVMFTSICSFDMRQKEKGRHWKDNRTLGNRAFFHYKETGMRSETGAMQIASSLTIDGLIPEDTGFYRCRVDFKEAPTKNTKIHLRLIGM